MMWTATAIPRPSCQLQRAVAEEMGDLRTSIEVTKGSVRRLPRVRDR